MEGMVVLDTCMVLPIMGEAEGGVGPMEAAVALAAVAVDHTALRMPEPGARILVAVVAVVSSAAHMAVLEL